MTAQTLFKSLLRYKTAADDELLNAMTALGAESETQDFQTALRVLNHFHVVDCIFAANLQRMEHHYEGTWPIETPPLRELSTNIRRTDQWYLDYISEIAPDELPQIVGFTFTDGGMGSMSREEMLAHVITHGGYHRGEIGRLLPQIEATAMRDVFTGYLHRSEPERRARI